MKLHRLLTSLLILLLLLAQQAAYAHAVSHLGKEPPPQDQLAHAKLCGKCVSFDKLSAVAPAATAGLATLVLSYAQHAEAESCFHPLAIAAFQSRAPPALS